MKKIITSLIAILLTIMPLYFLFLQFCHYAGVEPNTDLSKVVCIDMLVAIKSIGTDNGSPFYH